MPLLSQPLVVWIVPGAATLSPVVFGVAPAFLQVVVFGKVAAVADYLGFGVLWVNVYRDIFPRLQIGDTERVNLLVFGIGNYVFVGFPVPLPANDSPGGGIKFNPVLGHGVEELYPVLLFVFASEEYTSHVTPASSARRCRSPTGGWAGSIAVHGPGQWLSYWR